MERARRFPTSAIKFGVFAALCVVLAVGLAARIANLSLFSSRHVVYAQLGDVTGLTGGDPVDIAGVPVGRVSSIVLQRGHALVGLSLDNTVVLRHGTDVGLRWHNVIGQKDVYLYPQGTGPILAPGSVIPLSHDVSDASVDAFLNSIGPFLASINAGEANTFVENVSGALQGDTVEIDQLINNAAVVSHTVGGLDVQVGQVIDSLDKVLTAIASRRGDVTSLVDNLQTVAQSLASKNDVLDHVVGNLSSVSADLAKLIGANRSTLDSTITNLNTVTQTIVENQDALAQSLATAGSGLAPYMEISSFGQWFQVQTIYTCLANQSTCTYYQPLNPPAGSGPGGGPPGANPLSGVGAAAGSAGLPGASGLASPAPSTPGAAALTAPTGAGSSLPDILGTVGGTPTAPGSGP